MPDEALILAVTGIAREARIVSGPGVRVVMSASRPEQLRARLESACGGARAIISIGIAGGLSPRARTGETVIASAILDGGDSFATDAPWNERLCAALPDAVHSPIAGSSSVVMDADAKAVLHRAGAAYAVDMESHIAVRFARARGLPFACLRVISDGAGRALPEVALTAINPDGGIDAIALMKSLAAKPWQIPALIRAGRDSGAAFAALLRCRKLLGFGLGCPYLG